MRVIPVLDLMRGEVVRGVGGRRDEYRALRSRLVDSARPLDVARAFRSVFGLPQLYVADLDALRGGEPQVGHVRALAADGFELLVDAGLRDAGGGHSLLEAGAARVVAALETSSGPEQLAGIVRELGPDRVTFSLDLKAGRVLGDSAPWGTQDPLDIARRAVECGIRSLIVLDLAGVGEGRGVPTIPLCRRLRSACDGVEIITGGGVRDAHDLAELAAAEVDGVLVASALHDGALLPDDVSAPSPETS
jgi:phosphoribosylformimino-5-aminoimidazole carboxamide ribotide isomerase